MKMMPVLIAAAVLTTGCVPSMYTAGALARSRHRSAPRAEPSLPSPVGRWDNIMMLEAGTPLRVLTIDGHVATGHFVSANIGTVTIATGAREVTVDAGHVMRIDREAGSGKGALRREAIKGAALGAGAAGVAGLLFGVTPPTRVFAAAGVIGAYQEGTGATVTPGPATVYLAPSVISSTGAQ